jgi:hypothetical protein
MMTQAFIWEAIRDATGQSHPVVLSVAEAAKVLHISSISVRWMIQHGEIHPTALPGLVNDLYSDVSSHSGCL